MTPVMPRRVAHSFGSFGRLLVRSFGRVVGRMVGSSRTAAGGSPSEERVPVATRSAAASRTTDRLTD